MQRDSCIVKESDRIWPLIEMIRNTWIDDLTDERIQQLVDLVDSWRVTDADGKLLPHRRPRPARMTQKTEGFAIKNKQGEILVKTVSDTERAAMVNWLMIEASVAVWHDWSDEKITGTFSAYAFPAHASVIPVEVREVTQND